MIMKRNMLLVFVLITTISCFGQTPSSKQVSLEGKENNNQAFQSLNHQEKINFIIHQKMEKGWRLEKLGDFITHPDDLEYINNIQKTAKNYPFTVFGDFDYDGTEDVALKVTRNGESKLAIYNSKKDELFWWNENVVRAVISKTSSGEIYSFDRKKKIKPKGIVIKVEFLEVSAYFIYWDGKNFKQFWY